MSLCFLPLTFLGIGNAAACAAILDSTLKLGDL
jgi:hypothetical protein